VEPRAPFSIPKVAPIDNAARDIGVEFVVNFAEQTWQSRNNFLNGCAGNTRRANVFLVFENLYARLCVNDTGKILP